MQPQKKTHALIEAPGHPNTNHWLFHIQSFHSQKLFSDAEVSTFLSPLKPFWFVTSLSSKQTTHQPTTNHYFSHVGCCNLGQFVTPHQTKAQQKQGWWWWNLLAQTQWGRLHFFIKVSKVIYGEVQQETTLKMGEGKSSPLWLLEEAGFTHTHQQHSGITLPGFRGRTRGGKIIRRRQSTGTQGERKWSGVKQQELIYLGFVMCWKNIFPYRLFKNGISKVI